MFSRLKKQVVDSVKAPLVLGDYDTLQSLDEDDIVAHEKGDVPVPDGRLTLPAHVVRKLQLLKLTVTILASLLALVFFIWTGREIKAKRALMTSSQYSFHSNEIDYLPVRIPELYSPALEAIEYKSMVFHNNFHEDRTPWQGPPNEEVDKAWDAIYRGIGVIKIPKTQADQLPNHTLPIPGEDDGYIVGLEVYHQLHCLDFLRRALYPDYYGGDKDMTEQQKKEYWIHIDHCVDNLRQTITCYSDISTIPWKWMDRVQAEFPDAHTTHICRDFDKLTEWMLQPERHFPQEEYQIRLDALHSGAGRHGHVD